MKTSKLPGTVSERTDGRRKILAFLQRHPIGTLTTVTPDGEPHGAVVYYSIDDSFTVRFTTKRRTRKFDNLAHHNHAMLVVYEASSQITVQVTGVTEEVADKTEAQLVFRDMLGAAMETGEGDLPPPAKVYAGRYVTLRLRPVQVRMAAYSRPDPGGFKMYESLEFDL